MAYLAREAMIDADDYTACETYCFKRSWRLRLIPKASQRLIRRALELVALSEGWDAPNVRVKLAVEIVQEYDKGDKPIRSAAIIWLLLQILLPIVVRLVIEWWINREKARSDDRRRRLHSLRDLLLQKG